MVEKKTKAAHRAIGYCRVSTSDQADFGVSLDAQTERIRAWCAANGYALGRVLVDRGLSGGRCDNRPALQEALRTVGGGDSLVVYSLSRLARSTRDTLMIAETLDRRGADLVSLSERIDTTSSTGKMVFRMLAVLSEFERDVISERTSMAMAHLRSSGKYTGGFEPYGYRNVDGSLEVLPHEMEVVRIIHRLHGDGLSLRGISRRLHSNGFYSRSGNAFQPIQIARILRTPAPTEDTSTEPPSSPQEPSEVMGGTHA
jgi:DNA invertase Pin-like site-specific DNA recombinase